MLTITAAASSRLLLSEDELRAAIGVASGEDTAIAALNARIADIISRACRVTAAGITPPTLREETLTEKIFLDCSRDMLILSRPPSEITSVTEDDVAVASTLYEIEGLMLRRLTSDGYPTNWSARKTVVVYKAGWATVPDDLKNAACDLAKTYWNAPDNSRLRSMEIPGVISESYKDQSDNEPTVPASIMGMLQAGGYVWPVIG